MLEFFLALVIVILLTLCILYILWDSLDHKGPRDGKDTR